MNSEGCGASDITEIVAIDGPAGAGKSTVSREVAWRLGMAFLDTGAMYRAATWWAMHEGVDLDDAEAVVACTMRLPLAMEYKEDGLRVMVADRDVSEAIRTAEVTNKIKKIDGIPGVRDRMVSLQRRIGATNPTVAEGRDMGTVVFPHARCKVYLDASVDVRVRRRAEQLAASGLPADLETLRGEIIERDRNDMTRAVAPLKKATDAHVLDTSSLTFEQVVSEIVRLAEASP